MKGLKDQEITVHEFVGLVAPYTGDNGKSFYVFLFLSEHPCGRSMSFFTFKFNYLLSSRLCNNCYRMCMYTKMHINYFLEIRE